MTADLDSQPGTTAEPVAARDGAFDGNAPGQSFDGNAPGQSFDGNVPGQSFDGNAYRKAVLAPMLAAGVVSIEDPFRLIGLDPDCDDPKLISERFAEVVGFWQRERNSPRYKGLVGELVKRRGELQAMLLDAEKRKLARLRVQGTRRAQESARAARLDRLLKAVVARHHGLPRSRLRLLELLADREGASRELLAQKLAGIPILEDGDADPLPESLGRQIRGSLDELALLGQRAQAISLWSFIGLPANSPAEAVEARHADLLAANLGRAHDRAKTVMGDLLAQVKAVLLDPTNRAGYLVVLLAELRERLTDRVLELAVVDGELWPADVDNLVRDAVALGSGVAPEQAREAVRMTAVSLGVPLTTGKAPDYAICASCAAQTATGGPPGPVAAAPLATAPLATGGAADAWTGPAAALGGPAAAAAPAAHTSAPATPKPGAGIGQAGGTGALIVEEWRAMEREISQRRLTHALARAQRLARTAPDLPGPNGQLPQQRLVELVRMTTEAKLDLEAALTVPDLGDREAAIYAVLEKVPDLEEASAALAALPLGAPKSLEGHLHGTTMRLVWAAPTTGRTLTYSVVRVTRDARGARVEHQLGVTTRTDALDPDLPKAGLVWHEVIAQLGTRRSAVAATEPQPVVPDVSELRAARGSEGVTLTWNAPTGSDVVVERLLVGDADAPMKRSRARGSRWKDAEVEIGHTYRYVVRVEAAVGGVVARTPGCTVEVSIDEAPPAAPVAMPVFASSTVTPRIAPAAEPAAPVEPSGFSPFSNAAPAQFTGYVQPHTEAPAAAPAGAGPIVPLTVTSVPPGVVASWEAPPAVEVTVFASTVPLGQPGELVSPPELATRARVVGFAVGSGTAFDADPGPAVIFTPVAVAGGRAVVGHAVRHISVGPVEDLRMETADGRPVLRFGFPRGCGEALIVWRRDRPPADAADAEGGEVVNAEHLAGGGGWVVPVDDRPRFFHFLVLPVLHLGAEPVFGPGSSLRVG